MKNTHLLIAGIFIAAVTATVSLSVGGVPLKTQGQSVDDGPKVEEPIKETASSEPERAGDEVGGEGDRGEGGETIYSQSPHFSSSSSSSSSAPVNDTPALPSGPSNFIHYGTSNIVPQSASSSSPSSDSRSEQTSEDAVQVDPSVIQTTNDAQVTTSENTVLEVVLPNRALEVLQDPVATFEPSVISTRQSFAVELVPTTVAGVQLDLPRDLSAPITTSQVLAMLAAVSHEEPQQLMIEEQAFPTRAAVIAALVQKYDIPLVHGRAPFRDVDKDSPFADELAAAKRARLITGRTDANNVQLNEVDPEKPITRAEMNMLIRRLYRLGYVER